MRLLLSYLLFLTLPLEAAKRPNIVILLTDDQTCYSLGCYGNPDVQTPNMDGLARDGVAFDKHYNTTAICMASRASIMTGMLEYKRAATSDTAHCSAQHWERSYPVLLRQSGYRTAFAGKFGFEVGEAPGGKGKLPEE